MIKFYDFLLLLLKPLVVLLGKIGLPKRKVTGKDYYRWRDDIEIGTVILTKTNYELSNLINPTEIKHAGIYVGNLGLGKVCYVMEAVGAGVVFTDLVTFLTTKDIAVGCKPIFIRDKEVFEKEILNFANKVIGMPYDYLFNKNGKAYYCFELAAMSFKNVYSELQLKCKEIVKGKRIFDENTFLDEDFFEVIFDSRVG